MIKRASLLVVPLLLVLGFSLGVSYLLDNKKDLFTTRPVVEEKNKLSDTVPIEPVVKKQPQVKQEQQIAKVQPSSIPVIVVDPSHGGDDTGFVGYNGALESQANLQFSFMLARELRMRGLRVYLTRTDDKDVPLQNRIKYSNEIKPILHLSINCSYSGIASIKGMEIIAFTPEQKGDDLELAVNSSYEAYEGKYLPKTEDAMVLEQRVSRELKKALELPYRASLDRRFMKDLSVEPSVAGLSLFIGYISNPEDVRKLSNTKQMERTAAIMAEAIEKGLSLVVQER